MIDYILRQFNADCTIDQLVCHIGIDHLPDITISCIKCIQLHGKLVNARNRFKTLKYDVSKCKAILTKKAVCCFNKLHSMSPGASISQKTPWSNFTPFHLQSSSSLQDRPDGRNHAVILSVSRLLILLLGKDLNSIIPAIKTDLYDS